MASCCAYGNELFVFHKVQAISSLAEEPVGLQEASARRLVRLGGS